MISGGKLSQETRNRILEKGLQVVSRSGLEGLSLGPLAELSGLSKSGLFAHFGSKEEIQISILDHTAEFSKSKVLEPTLKSKEGLPRLRSLVKHWLGWSKKAGLPGGCPIAAGLFELDDSKGPVREKLLSMESEWRALLKKFTKDCVDLGELRSDLDLDQFVWELCGIYLVHHTSFRFLKDPKADRRAEKAFQALLDRSYPIQKQKGKKSNL
ncbi:TetR/AcrR family transcriptional regulator [Leptospira haakeii]|uniref:TetR family transcriptional regulator n=1 Tax=Leptospira haakeii TaxID=2023198 RepID=A0ABX4PJN1_9LEPT|nr:TetR/AcrR family transcriptional regulator [Leptospira haakeii]PKA15556.1 TetR family transcriptional regulator [Leptospira haakeii]PKA18923.1 TetR family transcriptional regulator [Leptospira haakeii]